MTGVHKVDIVIADKRTVNLEQVILKVIFGKVVFVDEDDVGVSISEEVGKVVEELSIARMAIVEVEHGDVAINVKVALLRIKGLNSKQEVVFGRVETDEV